MRARGGAHDAQRENEEDEDEMRHVGSSCKGGEGWPPGLKKRGRGAAPLGEASYVGHSSAISRLEEERERVRQGIRQERAGASKR